MYILNESDQRVRKNWLRLLIAITVFTAIFDFFSVFDHINADKVRSTSEIAFSFFVVFGKSLITLVLSYIIYYFAYKHHGNKYLMVQLLLSPFWLVGEFASTLKEFKNMQIDQVSTEWRVFLVITLCLTSALGIWWLVLGWKLRKINKKIHYQMSYGSKEYAKAAEAFSIASTTEELRSKFDAFIEDQPSLLVKALHLLYEDKKLRLGCKPDVLPSHEEQRKKLADERSDIDWLLQTAEPGGIGSQAGPLPS